MSRYAKILTVFNFMKGWNIEPNEVLLLVVLSTAVVCSLIILIWKLVSYHMRLRSMHYY